MGTAGSIFYLTRFSGVVSESYKLQVIWATIGYSFGCLYVPSIFHTNHEGAQMLFYRQYERLLFWLVALGTSVATL